MKGVVLFPWNDLKFFFLNIRVSHEQLPVFATSRGYDSAKTWRKQDLLESLFANGEVKNSAIIFSLVRPFQLQQTEERTIVVVEVVSSAFDHQLHALRHGRSRNSVYQECQLNRGYNVTCFTSWQWIAKWEVKWSVKCVCVNYASVHGTQEVSDSVRQTRYVLYFFYHHFLQWWIFQKSNSIRKICWLILQIIL